MTDKTTAEREALMRLADAYADASFTQGLERKTITPEPEEARSALDAALRGALAGRASLPLPGAQEAVGYLWQHCETGRTRVVLPDQVFTADACWIVVGPLFLGAAPQPALSAGWVSVKDRLPPCRDDQEYIGINSAGFAGIFNAVADVAGNVCCMMETAEESVSIMSDLSIWKPFTRPLPVAPSMDGESNG